MDEFPESAYEVRVNPRIRGLAFALIGIALMFDALCAWGIIRHWETHPRPLSEILLLVFVINVPFVLGTALIESYVYRVCLYVITPGETYAYRPLFGALRQFGIHDITRVEVGSSFPGVLWRGHLMTICGTEETIWCRLDMGMINIMRLSDELKDAMREKSFEAHYTQEQLMNMRQAEHDLMARYGDTQDGEDEV